MIYSQKHARTDHLKDLTDVFTILKKHNIRLNTVKCAYGVTPRNSTYADRGHMMADGWPTKAYLSSPCAYSFKMT